MWSSDALKCTVALHLRPRAFVFFHEMTCFITLSPRINFSRRPHEKLFPASALQTPSLLISCCVTRFNRSHGRRRRSLTRVFVKKWSEPTIPLGWNASLHSNMGALRIGPRQHSGYLWSCGGGTSIAPDYYGLVWMTLKLRTRTCSTCSAAPEPTGKSFLAGKHHAVPRRRTHACGCSCAGRVACVAPSLLRPPRPPGVCECSGNSVLGGSCSASRRLEHTRCWQKLSLVSLKRNKVVKIDGRSRSLSQT